MAIVIGFVLLPIALGTLATATEEAAARAAVQEAPAAPAVTPTPGVATSQARPPLLDRHYYFVNGCVSAPIGCNVVGAGNWGDYYTELGRLFGEAAASAAGQEQLPPYDTWAGEHVHFISVRTAADGAYKIEQALLENSAQSDVHMIGTSAGGASIFSYLGRAMRGEVPLDRRVRSAIAVDAPLGFQFPFRSSDLVLGIEAGVMKSDVELGIGAWAGAYDLSLLTADTPNDNVGHEPILYVADDSAPDYLQEGAPPEPADLECEWPSVLCTPFEVAKWLVLGSEWHAFTGGHVAESTRQFMEEQWR